MNKVSRREYILNIDILPKNILELIIEFDSLYGIISRTLFSQINIITSFTVSNKLSLLKLGKDSELIIWDKSLKYDKKTYKLPDFLNNISNMIENIHIILPDGSIVFSIMLDWRER